MAKRSGWDRSKVTAIRGWQRHHVLPLALLSNLHIAAFLRSMLPYGFSLHDYSTNGLLLPSSQALANLTGLPLHSGRHQSYNVAMSESLGQIMMANQHENGSVASALRAVRRLQSAVAKSLLLERVGDPIILSKRAPFQPRPSLENSNLRSDVLYDLHDRPFT